MPEQPPCQSRKALDAAERSARASPEYKYEERSVVGKAVAGQGAVVGPTIEGFDEVASRARALEASLRQEGRSEDADELAESIIFCRRLIDDAP